MHRTPPWLTLGAPLGVGGMGQVYAATDLRTNEKVAVKTLARFSGKELLCLKNEFRSFANVVHPNLVTQHELVEHEGQWFLLMECVEGRNLFNWLHDRASVALATPISSVSAHDDVTRTGLLTQRPPPTRPPQPAASAPAPRRHAPPDLGKLTHALSQLALVVDAIHQHGYLHRDLKPQNVLVAHDGTLKLLDFGIVIAREAAQREGDKPATSVVGTPGYVAPELITGVAPSPASDWYSFGVMLFELLAQRRPFVGTALEVFEAKLTQEAPRVSDFVDDVPPRLVDLTAQLLARTPTERPSFERIAQTLGLSLDPGEGRMASTVMVGREHELATLLDAARKSREKPALVLIKGRSGVGKSSLLSLCTSTLHEEGALVLEGRCYEQEHVPYKGVDKLVDSLAAELGKRPDWLASVLPDDREALARAFPVLSDVLGRGADEAKREVDDSAMALQRRALASLVDLFERLARTVRLVLVVDDMQWGDVQSAQLLAQLARPSGPGLLLIVSSRAEDQAAPPLVALREALVREDIVPVDLSVEPLTAADGTRLAKALAVEAGVNDPTVIEWAQRESQGEPFFLHELIFMAARDASMVRSTQRRTLKDVIGLRVERLPPLAQELLHAVCLAGIAVPQHIANGAVGQDNLAQAYRALRAAHFIRTTGSKDDAVVDTYHDKLREVVTAQLGERAQPLHARLGRSWERSTLPSTARRFAIARHFKLAGTHVGEGERVQALVAAAREAHASYDAVNARTLILDARACAEAAKLPFALVDLALLAEVTLASNDVTTAKQAFDQLAAQASTPLLRAQAHHGLARLAVSQLDSARGLAAANQGLVELGLPVVKESLGSTFGALFDFLWALAFEKRLKQQPPEEGLTELAANLYILCGNAAYFLLKRLLMPQALFRGYRHMLQLGGAMSVKYDSYFSIITGVLGAHKLTRKLSKAALSLATATKDPGTQATALGMSGMAIDFAGSPLEGEKLVEQTLTQYYPWLDLTEVFTMAAQVSWNRLMRGHPHGAWVMTQVALKRVAEAGDTPLSRGHTFRCYAGPELAMMGRAQEGFRHLDGFKEVLGDSDDPWRNTQWSAHRTLALHLAGADDATMEAAFENHARYKLKAKDHPHTLRQYFVAKALRRVEQAEAKPSDAEVRARAKSALADMQKMGKHPTIRLHRDVMNARFAAVEGVDPTAALTALVEEALTLESPWPATEALIALGRWKQEHGGAEQAAPYFTRARALIREHHLIALERRIPQQAR